MDFFHTLFASPAVVFCAIRSTLCVYVCIGTLCLELLLSCRGISRRGCCGFNIDLPGIVLCHSVLPSEGITKDCRVVKVAILPHANYRKFSDGNITCMVFA
jgi:hypothetical protein